MMCGVEADLVTGGPSRRAVGVPGRLSGDERLAEQVGSGNERAFATLFQRYHQQLYRYCRSLTGNDHDAQDALQSALTKAFVALRDGRRNAPVRPWLYRIAHNESISIIRSRDTAVELSAEQQAPRGLLENVEERERLALLLADLQDLPERQRGALVMRELNGLSHEEIAQALEVSPGAAKQTILEARRSLMEFEEGRAMPCDDIQRVISDNDRRSLRSRRVRAHLRTCPSCTTFAAAIPRRRSDMLALYPALPAAGAAGLLAKITGAGTGHGGGGGAGLMMGTAAKGVGGAISAKVAAVAGAAAVATAGVGVGAVAILHHAAPSQPAPSPNAASVSSGVAGSSHAAKSSHTGGLGSHLTSLGYQPGRNTRHSAVAAIHASAKSHGANGHPGTGNGSGHSTTAGNSAAHRNSAAGHGKALAPGQSQTGHGHAKSTTAPAVSKSQAVTHRQNVIHRTTRPQTHRHETVVRPTRPDRPQTKTTTTAKSRTSTTKTTTTASTITAVADTTSVATTPVATTPVDTTTGAGGAAATPSGNNGKTVTPPAHQGGSTPPNKNATSS